MRKFTRLAIVLAVVAVPLPAHAEFSPGVGTARPSYNGLWVRNPAHLPVFVDDLVDTRDAENIGLTKERVESRVKFRLTEAGVTTIPLSDEDPSLSNRYYLRVGVRIHEQAFSIQLHFFRRASFLLPVGGQFETFLPSWETGTIGIHGGDSGFVIESLDKYLEEFLLHYVQANSP